ncbi:hypothetical protein HDZ31DRAFT_31685 [Schizophyllum fasciatum]
MPRVHLWQFPYDALLERYMTSTAHYTRVLERTSESYGDIFDMRDAGDGYRCRAVISRNPSCTCPDKFRPCMHLIHIFLHILGVPAAYDIWYQSELDDLTLETLLSHPIGDRVARASRSASVYPAHDFDLYSAPVQPPRFTGPRISSVAQGASRSQQRASMHEQGASLNYPGPSRQRPSALSFDFSPWNFDDPDSVLHGPCSNIGSYRSGNVRSPPLDDLSPGTSHELPRAPDYLPHTLDDLPRTFDDLSRTLEDVPRTPALTLDSPQSLLDHWSPPVLTPTDVSPASSMGELHPASCMGDASCADDCIQASSMSDLRLAPELVAAAEEVLEREIVGMKRPFDAGLTPTLDPEHHGVCKGGAEMGARGPRRMPGSRA